VSAHTPDGKASGWYGQAARDWSTINPREVAHKAIDLAKRGVNASAVEPGRRTAILSPFAMAQVMRHLSHGFNAYYTDVLHSTVFTVIDNPDRRNKIGLRIFDPRIMITSDPADPAGGYFPFGDLRWDSGSMPTRAMTYVKEGVLQDLSYPLYYGLNQGKPFNQEPWSMRVDTTPGTKLQTLDEMIANCEEGIYVNRFSDIDELDSLTGMQTGTTRDGCFLVKNGKIDRPVKNFRFVDSPMYFLNRLVAIGKPERTALGFTPPIRGEPSYASDWPRRPMVMPPVMVNDFNFTGLSDAV
jgi:predicted Zn-dependent protease